MIRKPPAHVPDALRTLDGKSRRLSGHDHKLTFFFFPSPHGIDWSSPKNLTLTTIKNQLGIGKHRHPIGHVNIGLTSTNDSATETTHFLTGMVAQSAAVQRKQVLGGYGLGVLFSSVPGRLESIDEVNEQLPARYASGKLSFLTFRVSPSTAARLAVYVDAYRNFGLDHSYGLQNRPLHGEGAGCSAFAASFLEVAGLQFQELRDNWTLTRTAPLKLLGGPDAGEKVPLWRVLGPAGATWATAGEPGEEFTCWDPDAMHAWLTNQWNRTQRGEPPCLELPLSLSHRGRALGIIVNARDVHTPSGPIFHS
ncbi:MAG: hypothetical protein A2341_05935 [Deltaproteobacteria bacterium RIFOXYB12_FULL_58_9]|nr:MAG: hypothetical protein A2341_05935 [Deltaproteobacteria bacterium RIFOXYB12_FULL_58_9]